MAHPSNCCPFLSSLGSFSLTADTAHSCELMTAIISFPPLAQNASNCHSAEHMKSGGELMSPRLFLRISDLLTTARILRSPCNSLLCKAIHCFPSFFILFEDCAFRAH